jgi:hypothetical protein
MIMIAPVIFLAFQLKVNVDLGHCKLGANLGHSQYV